MMQRAQLAYHLLRTEVILYGSVIRVHDALCEWVGQDTSDEEVANMMAIADGDKSGKIDFWEVSTSSRDFLLPIVCPSCARHMRCPRRTHGILPHPPFAGDG